MLNKSLLWYKLRHWLFSWRQDEDGDICFVILNRLTFVKYKEHTLIRFDGGKLVKAGKYQGRIN